MQAYSTSLDQLFMEAKLDTPENNIYVVENSDVVAMACCKNTDAACWTQM